MTEDEVKTDGPAMVAEHPSASFGARLAAAREKEGLSVGDMAARLRLHVNQVRAIEGEDLGKLPEAAYVRGFVRSYARSVGLDPAPLIDDLNAKLSPDAHSVVDGMARSRDYSPVRAAAQERASRSVVLGLSVIALLALAAVGYFATRQTSQPSAPATPPMTTSPAPQAAGAPAAASSSAPAIAAAEAAPSPVTEPAPAPSQPLSESGALLVISFSGSSWVEVTDAAGKVLVSQTAGAGESVQPVGTPPITVVIGDASKATVKVRGEPYDLQSATRANVARFTVK